jgi:hypothetical protein
MLKELSHEHKLIAMMFAIGYSPEFIAANVGKTRQTLYNLKKDDLFQKAVDGFEREYHKQIMTKAVCARTKIEEAIERAVDIKIKLMEQSDNMAVANKAASDVLIMGGVVDKFNKIKDEESDGHLWIDDPEYDTIKKPLTLIDNMKEA